MLEVFQILNGREVVKYRRKAGTEAAAKLIGEVDSLPEASGYHYRTV